MFKFFLGLTRENCVPSRYFYIPSQYLSVLIVFPHDRIAFYQEISIYSQSINAFPCDDRILSWQTHSHEKEKRHSLVIIFVRKCKTLQGNAKRESTPSSRGNEFFSWDNKVFLQGNAYFLRESAFLMRGNMFLLLGNLYNKLMLGCLQQNIWYHTKVGLHCILP